MKVPFLGVIAAAALVVTGCAQAPTADIDSARQALDSAKSAQAADYAPDAWNAAQDAQNKLDAELQAQQNKMSLFRSYGKAKALAADLKSDAEQAVQAAQAGKEKAKNEASDLMAQARVEYAKAQKELASAPHGKGTEADLASLKADSTSIGTTLDEMQKAFDAGDYLTAKTKAQSAISASQGIESQVEGAKSQRRAA
jgi:hypothetical protein